ncbi:Asp-tRNA(Asn)/Glu-tRNA(Gln) amidotransferase subunit GatC [Candidatus Daviesbacteria bacterium]|nr:Asp-tRNA(Asn)/Glu-tRNA(Gln) amidotransferase subunit GatC [Candidatus Daviesbacteria bacterium]
MKIDVVKVAKLANLPLSKEEEEKYAKQLSQILDYMEKLNQADTLGVEATSSVTGLSNVMREDETEVCIPIKKGFYVTKGVFQDE